MKFRTLLISGTTTILLIVLVMAGVTYRSTVKFERSADLVVQAEETITNANLLLKLMVDMETGARGFMLIGSEAFLEPFDEGRASFDSVMAQTVELVGDDPSQVARLERVDVLEAEWLKDAGLYGIEVKRAVDRGELPEKAVEYTVAGLTVDGRARTDGTRSGKEILDEIRDVVDEFVAAERAQLDDLAVEREATSQAATRLLVVGTGLALALGLAVSGYTMRRLSGSLGLESLEETVASLERLSWADKGVTGLDDVMRRHRAVGPLTDGVIRFLCEYLPAPVGVLYLADGDHAISLSASYAYTMRKNLSDGFGLGEGVAGQVAKERKPILLSDVPPDYAPVSSALGSAPPKAVLAVPLIEGGELRGVIEVGSLGVFTDGQLAFLEGVSERVAIAIGSARRRVETEELLAATQSQAERLAAQQAELAASNEELEEQTQALRASEEELRQQTEELRASEEELRQQTEELRASNEELEEKTESLLRQNAEVERQKQELERAKQDIETQAERLEIAGKYKSQFLSNMSHELRTPLNSMLILSESLAGNREGNLTDSQVEAARVVHSSGRDLLNLINEILDLSKVEAGKMQVEIEDVDLAELIDDVAKLFRPMAEEKGLELRTVVHPEALSVIRTDPRRVGQILRNLLGNSMKFTREGSVTVEVGRPGIEHPLRRSGDVTGQAVAISVVDTGVGIPEEKRSEIFEAFQQADGSTSRLYGGTGLGLTISRELAIMLGGSLRLEETSADGSIFTLFLPDETPALAVHGTGHSEPPVRVSTPTAEETVEVFAEAPIFIEDDRADVEPTDRSLLIVEDDEIFARALMGVARERGFKCLATDSGHQALILVRQYQPSAILLDLGLPDIDGSAVLESLKHDLKSRHIPIHVISARDDDRELLRLGAVGYAQKPVSSDGMAEILGRLEQHIETDARNILVVEDDPASRLAIAELLGSAEAEITEARTGHEALEALGGRTFDCVILDLGLPDMSGFELLAAIAEMPGTARPPVVVYTARQLTREENRRLEEYSARVVIKGSESPERLVDDVTLFLHSVEESLPAAQREMISPLHHHAAGLQGKTVLIVDDDVRNIFALSRVLVEEGVLVESADDGAVGLEKLQSNPNIDLVIMDIMMPVMDGLEAIRRIRAGRDHASVPIIALTAKAMPHDRNEAIAAGANDYITKPVNIEELFTLMRMWLFQA